MTPDLTSLPRPVPVDHLLSFHAEAAPTSSSVSGDELRRMIADAAYLRALQRAFVPGHEVQDWLSAEQDILSGIKIWRQT